MITTDYFPIGGILPFGGKNVNEDVWIMCDGRTLNINEYPELFDKIGYNYGGEEVHFNIPDYRGYFMRGVSGNSKNDPDAGDRVAINKNLNARTNADNPPPGTKQEYATKIPVDHFLGSAFNLPGANIGVSGETKGGGASDSGDYSGPTCTGGGDAETRPINVYVQFYIKVRN